MAYGTTATRNTEVAKPGLRKGSRGDRKGGGGREKKGRPLTILVCCVVVLLFGRSEGEGCRLVGLRVRNSSGAPDGEDAWFAAAASGAGAAEGDVDKEEKYEEDVRLPAPVAGGVLVWVVAVRGTR